MRTALRACSNSVICLFLAESPTARHYLGTVLELDHDRHAAPRLQYSAALALETSAHWVVAPGIAIGPFAHIFSAMACIIWKSAAIGSARDALLVVRVLFVVELGPAPTTCAAPGGG